MKPVTVPDDFGQFVSQVEKDLMRLGRRAIPSTAADLLGPGLAPNAVQVTDWNDDATAFNGIYYSAPGAGNAPDDTLWWIGYNLATSEAYGTQVVQTYRDDIAVPVTAVRTFTAPGGGRIFGSWTLLVAHESQYLSMSAGPQAITSGAGAQTINGLSADVDVPSTLVTYEATLQVSAQKSGATDASLQCTLEVDGTPRTRSIVLSSTEASARHSATATWRLQSLTPGTRTIRARAVISAGAGDWNITTTQTALSVRRA